MAAFKQGTKRKKRPKGKHQSSSTSLPEVFFLFFVLKFRIYFFDGKRTKRGEKKKEREEREERERRERERLFLFYLEN